MPSKTLVWGTNWVGTTVVIRHMSPNMVPNEIGPKVAKQSARQRDFRLESVVHKCCSSPRGDQCTTSDKDKVFHALDAEIVILCPVEPLVYMISDVVFEHFRADNVVAATPVGKR